MDTTMPKLKPIVMLDASKTQWGIFDARRSCSNVPIPGSICFGIYSQTLLVCEYQYDTYVGYHEKYSFLSMP
eukprot:scaffold260440_cov18-Prasinocladus_malaysianus.AAC.1